MPPGEAREHGESETYESLRASNAFLICYFPFGVLSGISLGVHGRFAKLRRPGRDPATRPRAPPPPTPEAERLERLCVAHRHVACRGLFTFDIAHAIASRGP